MAPRKEQHRLEDIRDAIIRIESYTAGGLPDTSVPDAVWDAVLYNLAVIGEAIKDLSEAAKARAPEIDWSAASKMRDVIIHGYFATDLTVVAATLSADIPELKRAVEKLLADPDH